MTEAKLKITNVLDKGLFIQSNRSHIWILSHGDDIEIMTNNDQAYIIHEGHTQEQETMSLEMEKLAKYTDLLDYLRTHDWFYQRSDDHRKYLKGKRHELDASDVALMMTLVKVSRAKNNPCHADNWVDGAGYMACGGEIGTANVEYADLTNEKLPLAEGQGL